MNSYFLFWRRCEMNKLNRKMFLTINIDSGVFSVSFALIFAGLFITDSTYAGGDSVCNRRALVLADTSDQYIPPEYVYGIRLYQGDVDVSVVDKSDGPAAGMEIGLRRHWLSELLDSDVDLSTSIVIKQAYKYNLVKDTLIGDGKEALELRANWVRALPADGRLGFEMAYRYQADYSLDEYRYLISYGFTASERAYFRLKLDGVGSVGKLDNNTQDDGYLSECDVGQFEVVAGWNLGLERDRRLGRWDVELSYTNDIYGDSRQKDGALQLGFTRAF